MQGFKPLKTQIDIEKLIQVIKKENEIEKNKYQYSKPK